MRALVTGATGFLGSHIAGALTRDGHCVRVLHRPNSNLSALQEQLADAPHETVIGDVLEEASLKEACAECDWVFHCAAVADYWRADRERLFHVNIEGTRRLLAAALSAGAHRVVFTSSASSIGPRADGQPTCECEPFRLDKTSFPYAWSKWQAEGICAEFAQQGLDVVILNPTVIVGPGDLNLLAGSFMRMVKKLGAFTPVFAGGATLIDVRDVARQHIAAAEHGQAGERYLLGAEKLSFTEWFALIAEAVDAPRPQLRVPNPLLRVLVSMVTTLQTLRLPIRANTENARLLSQHFYYDCRKADEAFGPPAIAISQSLRDCYAWYERNGYTVGW